MALNDSLLTPRKLTKKTRVCLQDEKGEISDFSGDLTVVLAAQKQEELSTRNMDDAFFGAHRDFTAKQCLELVREYYTKIDAGDNEWVKDFFDSDIDGKSFSFKRTNSFLSLPGFPIQELSSHEMDTLPCNATYKRVDHIMKNHSEISDFYSEKGRTLSGNHTISQIAAIPGFVLVTGEFSGTSGENTEISLSFGDVWHFTNGNKKIGERRTYLSSSQDDLYEALSVTLEREITPQDIIDQVTFQLSFGNSIVAEIIGMENNPDRSLLMNIQGEKKEIYMNTRGDSIR